MKQKRIPGIIAVLIQLIASVCFMVLLYQTKLIPNKLLLLIGGILLFITLVILLLTIDFKHRGRFFAGVLLIFAILVVYVLSGSYVIKGVKTLTNITKKTTVERAGIGIYVREDDPAASVEDTAGYHFGILKELDRKNTDLAIEKITATTGAIETENYSGITELVDSLLQDRETDAILLNSEFFALLEETEGYENVQEQLREIHVEQVETKVEEKEEAQVTLPGENGQVPKVFTVYVSGIDSRTGLIAKSRSDVNIIATVNTETRKVLLVSTPRDFYVPLSISNGVPDKLTHAGIYGIDVSMETLEMLYQTDIDYYFRVNFNGFEKIIDALGGVTIVSDFTFDSQNSKGYSFVEGENDVNGEAALAFVRERYAFSAGDRQRGKNQLAVIEGVIKKAMSPALLQNYSKIMESVEGSFETSVPYDVIAGLVRKQLNEGGQWTVESYSVDGSGATKRPYSMSANAYVMVPNMDTVNTAIEKMNQIKGEDK